MKSFLVAVVLAFVVIFFTVWYSNRIAWEAEKMLDLVNELSVSPETWEHRENRDTLAHLKNTWEKKKRLLEVGMHREQIESVDSLLRELSAAAQSESFSLYRSALNRLEETFSRMVLSNRMELIEIL